MPDTSVKFLHSGMLGAPAQVPVFGGSSTVTAQAIFNLLKAVLVDGFNQQAVASISVADGVATANFQNTHGFETDTVVRISGASVSALNGDKRVAGTPSGFQFTFDATGVPDQQVLTGASTQYAPLGWSLLGSPTTLPATFCSTDPTGTGVAFTFTNQSGMYRCSVTGYRNVVNGTPANAFASTKYIHFGSATTGPTSYGAWALVGDSKTFYLLLHTPSATSINIPQASNGLLFAFGDFESLAPADAFRSVLHSAQAVPAGSNNTYSITYLSEQSLSNSTWLAGSLGGGGTSDVRSGLETLYDGVARLAGASGATAATSYPNAADTSLILSRRYIADGAGVRGFFRGLYQSPQPCATAFAPLSRVDGNGPLAGRRLIAMRCGLDRATADTVGDGVTFFDLTGPWA